MRKKHFVALFIVFILLVSFNLCGLFSFLNNWGYDQLAKLGPSRPVSPEIVAIRVQPNDDLDALIEYVQKMDYKSLSLLMLNTSGTLTSHIFSSKDDVLQFKSSVRPPDSLTWRGPEDINILNHKLKAICQSEIDLKKSVYLDFRAGKKEIPKFEANQVITGEIKAEQFKDKLVVIGDHFSSQTQFYSSPVHQGEKSLTALSKEILLIDAAVNNSWVSKISNGVVFSLALVVVAGLIIGFRLHPYMRFKRLILGLLIGCFLFTILLLKVAHVWFPPASLLFTVAASGFILYLASYREWKETLHKLVNEFEKDQSALLVYGPKGLLKYHSKVTEQFLAKHGMTPRQTDLGTLLEAFSDQDFHSIQSIIEATKERQESKHSITLEDESYLLSIKPLKDGDTFVAFEKRQHGNDHHQEPKIDKSNKVESIES